MASPKLKASESQVERMLMNALATLGYLPIKTDAGARARWYREIKGKPIKGDVPQGFPDLVVCHPASPPFFVEVKREGGKLSPAQLRMHRYLRDAGYIVAVVYGVPGVEALLNALPHVQSVEYTGR